jgi:hypothetical protein
MENRLGLFALVSIAAVSVVAACSVTTTTTQTPPADAGTDAPTTKDSGTSSAKDSGKTDEDTNPDEACAAKTADACQECCGTNHQQGAGTLTAAAIACVCKGQGSKTNAAVCETECADTFCAAQPKQPDAACGACLEASLAQDGACLESVATACQADDDCMAAQECAAACPQ